MHFSVFLYLCVAGNEIGQLSTGLRKDCSAKEEVDELISISCMTSMNS